MKNVVRLENHYNPWDLVIGGDTHCTTYGEVFRSGPVIVSECVKDSPRPGSASAGGPD
jgi:hypothetical protein